MPETRRRGAELEDALRTAAWDELLAVGYGAFTIEGVADRARTSRPVLYRRWPTRAELAIAAVRHFGLRQRFELPDTGSLRGDLIELLRRASALRSEVAVLVSVHMGQFFAETGSSPADLRDILLAGRQPYGYQVILDRAHARGEIDIDGLSPRVARLPMDLLRHELLFTFQPLPDDVIVEIVDDITLPLLRRSPGR